MKECGNDGLFTSDQDLIVLRDCAVGLQTEAADSEIDILLFYIIENPDPVSDSCAHHILAAQMCDGVCDSLRSGRRRVLTHIESIVFRIDVFQDVHVGRASFQCVHGMLDLYSRDVLELRRYGT